MDRSAIRLAAFAVGLVLGGLASGSHAALPATGTGWGEPALVFKSAIAGTVSVDGPFHVWPPANTGTGGVTLKGTQGLKLPGAPKATINFGKLVTAPALATVARAAGVFTGFSTALAVVGLAYEGIQLLNGEWQTTEVPLFDPFDPLMSGALSLPLATSLPYCPGVGPGFWRWNPSAVVACVASDAEKNALVGAGWSWNANNSPNHRLMKGYTGTPPDNSTTRPATDGEVETALSNALAADPAKASALANAVAGYVPVEQWVKGPAQGSGPASIPATAVTSTTVSDAGTATKTEQKTYNLTFQGDTVNITETVVTTITAPDNSVTTTTTTTTAPEGGGESPPPEPPTDVCVEHPDASGCQPLGENEDDTELDTEDRDMTFESELSAAGACPTGQALTILGTSHTLEWSPLCDLATGVRPVVLALSWLSAGVFVFMIGRGTTA